MPLQGSARWTKMMRNRVAATTVAVLGVLSGCFPGACPGGRLLRRLPAAASAGATHPPRCQPARHRRAGECCCGVAGTAVAAAVSLGRPPSGIGVSAGGPQQAGD